MNRANEKHCTVCSRLFTQQRPLQNVCSPTCAGKIGKIARDTERKEIKTRKEKAKTITEYIEAKVEKQLNEKTTVFTTKEDLANTKVDLIKWMVGFWLIQMATIIGLYIKG